LNFNKQFITAVDRDGCPIRRGKDKVYSFVGGAKCAIIRRILG